MTTRKLTVISAGLAQPSSTRLLAERLAAATERRLTDEGVETQIDLFDLRDVAQDITNNLLTGFASPRLQKVIDAVTGADGLVAVTPIYTTSYSGLFKSFMDILDPQSITGMPVAIAATGGTERHSLALDYAMRPLFSYLHAVVVPTAVYAASSDWGSGDQGTAADAGSSALPERIERAAGELASLVRESDRSSRVVDPFALPAGFSPVGAYGAQ
ncbi:FMN reductase [soil metagenome]